MFGTDVYERLYVISAFAFQLALIFHFAMRKWAFDPYIPKLGWLFYSLSIPAVIISLVIWRGGGEWSYWLAGVFFLTWAIFGYVVEYGLGITTWRNPINWSILGPYVTLYLATSMFYWFPLGNIARPLWFVYGVLFVISTGLNIWSH